MKVTHTTGLDLGQVKIASRYSIHICGHCPNAHIVLWDENHVAFAMFTIAPVQVDPTHTDLKTAIAMAREDNVRKQL